VSGKNSYGTGGNFFKVIYEDSAFLSKLFNDMMVVDNFVAHVDWRMKFLQGHVYYGDGPVYSGAEASWLG
jgi:hypothetical protein